MIKALVFDLDDTLYKEIDFVYAAFLETSTYIACKYNVNQKLVYGDMINFLKNAGRGRIFDGIIEKYNLKGTPDELVKVYRASKPNLELYSDAIQVLEWAMKKGYKLGVITDGCSQVQHNKIQGTGIMKYIHKAIVTYDFGEGYAKPHDRAYKEMLGHFCIKPQEMIYIGDNPNKDFIGAKQLGIHTIRIIRPYGDHMETRLDASYEADYEIQLLNEVPGVITLIDGREMR